MSRPMSEIAERLRATYVEWNSPPSHELPRGAGILLDGAEEIDRLEKALHKILGVIQCRGPNLPDNVYDIVHAALSQKDSRS